MEVGDSLHISTELSQNIAEVINKTVAMVQTAIIEKSEQVKNMKGIVKVEMTVNKEMAKHILLYNRKQRSTDRCNTGRVQDECQHQRK